MDEFYGLLSTYVNLDWIAPNLEIAHMAVRFRAIHSLKTPDALQAATAAHGGVTALITNDAVFERVRVLELARTGRGATSSQFCESCCIWLRGVTLAGAWRAIPGAAAVRM